MKKAILESLEKAVLAVRFAGREESLVFIEKVVLLLAHTFETGKKSIKAGANRLVTGTHFFHQPNRKEAMQTYNELRKI